MNTHDVQNSQSAPRRSRWVRKTHRVLGVSSLLFVLLISLSGLILNHADALGISRHAAPMSIIRLYGMELPPVESAFVAAGVLFATSSETLYANGEELAKQADALIGAVAIDGGMVVATRNEFLVTNRDAALIERFTPDALASMSKLGTHGGRIIVTTPDGLAEFDPQQMRLLPSESSTIDRIAWSLPASPSEEQAEAIGAAALGQAISWERVLLDLHSGRILPGVGRFLADLTALCLLYMCGTGLVLWTRRFR